jgi:dihydrofolate reductase
MASQAPNKSAVKLADFGYRLGTTAADEFGRSPLKPFSNYEMKTQYYAATSLDGFIATDDDSLDWLFQLGDVNDTGYADFIKDVGALAMGSSTYKWMLQHVIKKDNSEQANWPYEQPTWVFTSKPQESIRGADIRFVSGDVLPVHRNMTAAADGKNVWIVGGGELVGQFYDAGLIDELILQVCSVTLGSGKPLLPRLIAFPPLQLQSARALGAGFAELRYTVPRAATP